MKYAYTMTALAALAAASPMLQVGTIHNDAAPILSSTQSTEIADNYMIVFKKHVKHEHTKDHHAWVQSIHTKAQGDRMELRKRSSQFPVTETVFEGLKHTYNIAGGIMGYSGHFDEDTIEAIRRHPDVSTKPSPSLTGTFVARGVSAELHLGPICLPARLSRRRTVSS